MPTLTVTLDDETAARLVAMAGMPHRVDRLIAQMVNAEWLRRESGIVGLAKRLENAEKEIERLQAKNGLC